MKRTGLLTRTSRWLGRVTRWKLGRVPDPCHGRTDFNALQFYVPLRECISGYGFAYDNDIGYHPLTTLLAEYEGNPELTYPESSLCTFYQRFNPRNLQEALLGHIADDSCLTARVPFPSDFNKMRVPIMPLPWSTEATIRVYLERTYRKWTSLTGEVQYRRTLDTYNSIRTAGFDPSKHSDGSLQYGFIRVVILRDGNSERVVITGGQHRVAALATLRWTYIPALFEYHLSATPPIVDLKNAPHWPVVKSGIYDLRAATRVFEALFSDYGHGRQKHFALARNSSRHNPMYDPRHNEQMAD